jgi:uncharacterized membrane protein
VPQELERDPREVRWMPALPGATLTLIISAFFFVGGTVVAAAAVVTLVVRASRRQWTPLNWLCVGALIGYGVYWALLGLHQAFGG